MSNCKVINIALQGGGTHGAFAWGILDHILEDGRIEIEGLTATSAGSMNAVVYAYGKMMGGNDGAREALHKFWHNVSKQGEIYSPVHSLPWEKLSGVKNGKNELGYLMFDMATRLSSPYQFNPMNINPLRTILEESVDFDKLLKCQNTKLFISTTNVRTGKVRVFKTDEVTIDVVLASACLPFLFHLFFLY